MYYTELLTRALNKHERGNLRVVAEGSAGHTMNHGEGKEESQHNLF